MGETHMQEVFAPENVFIRHQCGKQPICEATFFDSFAESHRFILALISGLCGFVAMFCLGIGLKACIAERSPRGIVLCLLTALLMFVFVFIIAHSSFS